jgi:hypothetical protein
MSNMDKMHSERQLHITNERMKMKNELKTDFETLVNCRCGNSLTTSS